MAEAAAVTEICQRLDGIPLAIELAASRMASMTASEMRNRLDHRFRLLVGSRRGLERHHTLRHAVAWSYDLLDDAEKALLERCSVFTGGFDLESACAVAGFGHDEYGILDLPDASVRKSLLVADQSAGEPGFRCWRRSANRRGTTRGPRRSIRDSGRPPAVLRRTGSRHLGPVGQPPAARGLHLVHHRTGQGSDAARYVNGTNMIIDNGLTAAILTNQADYSTMPTVDPQRNTAAT